MALECTGPVEIRAHCDLEFAVEVRQCPLRSGARCCEEEDEEEEEQVPLIKSRGPHLAGGGKTILVLLVSL